MNNTRLVYSTDPALNKQCPKCKELISECVCVADETVVLNQITAKLRIEKAGRGGKTVTVIDELPRAEKFLKELCTELKRKCGAGGTSLIGAKGGIVEIQGDKRDILRDALVKKGIKVKG
ncbi:stress response translation initiation inhibitor YciH [bacterium]|nr:stress response translation initiation inhibitor YciH [bacterium]